MDYQETKKITVFFQWDVSKRKDYYGYITYLEAIRKKRMHVITGPNILKNKVVEFLHRKTCKHSIIGKIWYLFYLQGVFLRKDNDYLFLFNDGHPFLMNLNFLKWLKKNYSVQNVLVIRNMIINKLKPSVCTIPLSDLLKNLDLVVTDEPKDAELYRLFYLSDPFSIICRKKAKLRADICFCGEDKKRSILLYKILVEANTHGISCDFKVIDNVKKRFKGINYVKMQPYTELIKQDMQANCILEILQQGQDGFTLRLQEAICLNKKLLTNNPKVKENPYYDLGYIQYFERIEDIDWDFVKEVIDIDYRYKGEYSPLVFLDKIEKQLLNNGGIK